MVVPNPEIDAGAEEQPTGPCEQQPAQIRHEVVAEEIDVDRDAERGQAEAPRMMGKLEIEQPPGAAEIAADARHT